MQKILIASVAVLGLSACEWGDRVSTLRNFGGHPVVRAASESRTRADVIAVQAPDRIVPASPGKLECLEYTLRKDEKSIPFYASVRANGRTGSAYGFLSCAEAQSRGLLDVSRNP